MENREQDEKNIFENAFFFYDFPYIEHRSENAAHNSEQHIRIDERRRDLVPASVQSKAPYDKGDEHKSKECRWHRMSADTKNIQNLFAFFHIAASVYFLTL